MALDDAFQTLTLPEKQTAGPTILKIPVKYLEFCHVVPQTEGGHPTTPVQ